MRKNADSRSADDMSDASSPDAANEDSQIVRSGLREQVTEHLLAAVFERRLVSGQHLVVQKLSQKLGVSPTPVRESLVELEGLGIVQLSPHRGAVVQPFGPRELEDMSQVRRALESEATRCAFGKIPRASLDALMKELEQLNVQSPSENRDRLARHADRVLHELVSDHCGNKRLAWEVRKYLTLFRALRNASHLRDSWNNYRHSNDVPEHLGIVNAYLAGTADQAAAAMLKHIQSVEKTLIDVLFHPAAH